MNCSNVITIPQMGSTCWFNAILMAVFHSQYINVFLKNKFFKENQNESDDLKKVFNLLTLSNNPTSIDKNKFYDVFKTLTPEYILGELHNINKNDFSLPNDRIIHGYFNHHYLYRLLNYIGVTNIGIYDYFEKNNELRNSYVDMIDFQHLKNSNKYSVTLNKKSLKKYNLEDNFDIIIIYNDKLLDFNKSKIVKKNFTIKEKLVLGNNTYLLDSTLLTNFNGSVCKIGHDVACITCNKKRYI